MLHLAVVAVLPLLSGGCNSEGTASEPAHSYVSTDSKSALIVGNGRYHFGPQLLADPQEILAKAELLTTKDGCYDLGIAAFAVPMQGEASCGPYVIRRVVEDEDVQQNQKRAGHSLAFRTYEATCKADVEMCPAMIWKRAAVRFYVSDKRELLGFELIPTTPDRQFFIRTSETALQL